MATGKLSFFDAGKARGPRRGPDVGEDAKTNPPAGEAGRSWSVSALISRIKGALCDALPQRIQVVGEISNFKLHGSGHMYFRLKDAAAAIDAAMFKRDASRLKFTPTDGLEVVVEGRVDVYDVRGQLQFYVEKMTPKGAGALELALRQLREKLRGEGLFDARCKKPLPRFPRAIGVVTSATGAAVRDIRRTLTRRWPAAAVYLVPVLVQGPGAAEDIAVAVGALDAGAERYRIDTIIVARGGGSLEDLWAFNEEVVARAIFAARTPIVSGVGHEVDFTIADLVADVRAPTPTGAAELCVPDRREVRRHVEHLDSRARRRIGEILNSATVALESVLRSAVFRDPGSRLRVQTQRIDEMTQRLRAGLRELGGFCRRRIEPTAARLAALHPARLAERAKGRLGSLTDQLRWVLGGRSKHAGDSLSRLESRLQAAHPKHRMALGRERVAATARQLDSMSYRSVLRRGYSVTRAGGGRILRSVADTARGDRIETELADGKMASVVTGTDRTIPNAAPDDAAPAAESSPRSERRKSRKDNSSDQPRLF